MDQGSNKNHSPAYNFTPTVTKFCVMWEGLSLPHDTKFGNCRCKIVDSRSFHSWSLIHGLRWSGLIKVGPGPRGKPLQRKHVWSNACGGHDFKHFDYVVEKLTFLLCCSNVDFGRFTHNYFGKRSEQMLCVTDNHIKMAFIRRSLTVHLHRWTNMCSS